MKKLEKDIFIRILFPFMGMFSLFLIFLYLLFKEFILEVFLEENLSRDLLMKEFHFLWIEVFILVVIFLLVMFFLIKKFKKDLLDDVNAMQRYIEDVSKNKNYDAVLHIKNYIEFLHISIYLKNIIKRFYKKSKK